MSENNLALLNSMEEFLNKKRTEETDPGKLELILYWLSLVGELKKDPPDGLDNHDWATHKCYMMIAATVYRSMRACFADYTYEIRGGDEE